MPLLMIGGRIIITRTFSPERSSGSFEEKPTVGIAVETILKAMAAHPEFMDTDFSLLSLADQRRGAHLSADAGAVLEPGDQTGQRVRNDRDRPQQSDPAAEHHVAGRDPQKWNSAGKLMYFNGVRVVDENGRDVPQGKKGELLWRAT